MVKSDYFKFLIYVFHDFVEGELGKKYMKYVLNIGLQWDLTEIREFYERLIARDLEFLSQYATADGIKLFE